MSTSDWITIGAVIASAAFGSGAVVAAMKGKFASIESDLNDIKKSIRKISRILTKHHYRIKHLEKKGR